MAMAEQKNQDSNQNTGGYLGELEANIGGFDTSSTSSAQGGRIDTGTIFNISSSGSIGLVKMLAIAGFALIAYRILRKK